VIEPTKPESKVGVASEEIGHPRGKPPKEKSVGPDEVESEAKQTKKTKKKRREKSD
jgi:hypothetical protein